MVPTWLKIALLSLLAAGSAACYQMAAVLVVAFGIGNESHFASHAFQLERANKLLELSGRPQADSLTKATEALLPPGARNASWSYDTGDDSWLCAIASLRWQTGTEWRRARWVIRYCADPLWREHFVEAAALDHEAKALTPRLYEREAIYGDGSVPTSPVDGGHCFVQ